MENFEAKLAQATAPETRDMLGAIGLVVNDKGKCHEKYIRKQKASNQNQEIFSTIMHLAANL
jgi:hypothetical protein